MSCPLHPHVSVTPTCVVRYIPWPIRPRPIHWSGHSSNLMVRQRSKRWLFTLNNYTEEEESMLRGLLTTSIVTYLVFGHETGENGTPHLQGYCETNSRCGLRKMKGIIGERAHLEKANGSSEQNRTYCTKQDADGFFEDGVMMSQGDSNNLTWFEAYNMVY